MMKIVKSLLVVTILLLPFAARGQTVNAASCSATDVQTAINTATAGQTVNIPAGNCNWGSVVVNLAKAITLNGAGQNTTIITLGTTSGLFNITKQTNGVTRIQNLQFVESGNKAVPKAVVVNGPWPTGQPVIFYNVTLTLNNSDFVTLHSPGGLIFSHLTFNAGEWSDTLVQSKDFSTTGILSWTTADSMGTHDTTGFMNTYIEDSVFNGGTWTDCDDACRIVVRHNTGNNSSGFNSHGLDTSNLGLRHYEIYNNSFLYPHATSCSGTQTSIDNINQYIWLRGGTGVIYNNNTDSLKSTCWGDKPEVRMSIRDAEDVRKSVLGSTLACSQVTYPAPHQLGQNNNGSIQTLGVGDFTDPIHFWGNTSNNGVDSSGTWNIEAVASWGWGNPCGFNWNTYFQWGRDAVNTTLGSPTLSSSGGSVDAQGGSAKPGYTAYAYPHPLVSGSSATAPAPPTGLAATVN